MDLEELHVEGHISVPFYSGCYYGLLPATSTARVESPWNSRPRAERTWEFSWGFPKTLHPNLKWKEVQDVKITEVILQYFWTNSFQFF